MNMDMLLGLPRSGVVILLKMNQVLVTYTTSMGAHLESLYNQFGGQTGITMQIVSAGADIETLKIHTEYYREYYNSIGYSSIQSLGRKSIKYRVRIAPSPEFKGIDVELVTARGSSKVVGRFKNSRDAKDFIETYYGTDNTFKLPVYAINSDTEELVIKEQTKMLELHI